MAELQPRGRILELACGTGYGTAQLAQWADEVTALDISPEMIEQARARLAGVATPDTFVQADIFDWSAPRRYDVVFFSFWLSHVPPDRFAAFWNVVRHALAPGGRAIFLDSSALDSPHEHTTDDGATTMVRQLNDGRQFRIVKVFYRPDELERRLRELGWSLEARLVGPFLVGAAEITDHSP